MGDIFMKLLNMSITASWLILAVLCIRLLFRKIPKWVNCLLWGVAAVRLVCPFSIESQLSILSSTEPIKTSTVVEGEVQNDVPSIDSRLAIVEKTINPVLTETFAYNESESVAPLQVVTYAAGLVWCCGMILLMICAAGSAVKLHKLVREAVCVRGNIYICDAVRSPFILGIVRPRIYLSSALGEREKDYILAHELAHLKRKDHWWKALGYLLLCIYWFNPLCWMAYFLLCRDIELACDEKVAKDMTFYEKKEYSAVLLSCAMQRSLVMACPLAFGEVGVKERVRSVLNYKKPALWIMIATAVVLVILTVCFLTNPTKEYQIKITIPAGSTEIFCYSDEEISPKGSTITLYAGEGLGDTEITLLPVEVREENAYDTPVYITPGMPVEMNVEKGAWFKIGVNIQNATDESKDVYVSVDNVEVRIASSEKTSVMEGTDAPTFTAEEDLEDEIGKELTMEALLELYENGGLTSKVEEEGLEGFLAYRNMKPYSGMEDSLTGLYTCDLVYPHAFEGGMTDDRNYELQLYYWRPETAEEYGHAENEIDNILLMEKESQDAVLLYEVDERFTATNDLMEFLQRDYGMDQYLICDLPDSFTLGAFRREMIFDGSWLLEGEAEEPPHGEGSPEAWYCPGGVGRGENASQILTFDGGALTDAFLWMNHTEQLGETEILEGCEVQAILAEYAFELFTASEWEDYLAQHPEAAEELPNSHYWYVFLGKEDSEIFYVLFLDQEHFTKDDVIRMAQSVRFTESAF